MNGEIFFIISDNKLIVFTSAIDRPRIVSPNSQFLLGITDFFTIIKEGELYFLLHKGQKYFELVPERCYKARRKSNGILKLKNLKQPYPPIELMQNCI